MHGSEMLQPLLPLWLGQARGEGGGGVAEREGSPPGTTSCSTTSVLDKSMAAELEEGKCVRPVLASERPVVGEDSGKENPMAREMQASHGSAMVQPLFP